MKAWETQEITSIAHQQVSSVVWNEEQREDESRTQPFPSLSRMGDIGEKQ